MQFSHLTNEGSTGLRKEGIFIYHFKLPPPRQHFDIRSCLAYLVTVDLPLHSAFEVFIVSLKA